MNCLAPFDALLQMSAPSIALTTARSAPGKSAAALLPESAHIGRPASDPMHPPWRHLRTLWDIIGKEIHLL